MTSANQVLESLDAADISNRLDEIEREREALRVLYRAALRLERLHTPTAESSKASRSAGGGPAMIAPAPPAYPLDPVCRVVDQDIAAAALPHPARDQQADQPGDGSRSHGTGREDSR